ncbi:uncharacterized protein Z518_02409 [Rhinocladiella mackenziei CBS 650.93]|uniref:Uncharacterized protein n=1 Tax=Rhinocladiella mackenziei CBS 650.93 TaxID=1442369 RepID=A0A0D2JEY4_9EURO|nr:uncharacterized protein Z518_02409 [Rhinocladiella mackenziei CBS 650.93]KIX07755.1 hypothetical protein Z518_02409 [Rhinocladiella mackenziei CBS 650.93]
MPNENWRDELQDYALLLEAVASGDRSKVVKLFGEYILRTKYTETTSERPQEVLEYDENQGYDHHDQDFNNDHQTAEEPYYPEVPPKRVRFADEEDAYYTEQQGFGQEDEEYGYEEEYRHSAEYDLERPQYAEHYMHGGAADYADQDAMYYDDDDDGSHYDDEPYVSPTGNERYAANTPSYANQAYGNDERGPNEGRGGAGHETQSFGYGFDPTSDEWEFGTGRNEDEYYGTTGDENDFGNESYYGGAASGGIHRQQQDFGFHEGGSNRLQIPGFMKIGEGPEYTGLAQRESGEADVAGTFVRNIRA